MKNFTASVHIKKKEKKRIEKEYVEFSSHHAVPPLIAAILMVLGMGVLGLISWQLWQMGNSSLQIFLLGAWYLVALLGVILWRSLYHRRIEVYPSKIVVYDIFSKSELQLTNIIGYRYKNSSTLLFKHRGDKRSTKIHLDVDARQHLEQWIRDSFTDLDAIS